MYAYASDIKIDSINRQLINKHNRSTQKINAHDASHNRHTPPTKASPAPLVSTISSFLIAITGNSYNFPSVFGVLFIFKFK